MRRKTKTRTVNLVGDIPIIIQETVDVFTGKRVLDMHTPRSSGEDVAFVINFKAYRGKADDWDFLIVGCDIPGYEPIRQYRGTATKRGVILMLPPDVARKAGERAETPL